MSKNSKAAEPQKPATLQLRIPADEPRGAELIAKLEKVAKANGLSMNDVGNMAIAAGLSMVETKLKEIHHPVDQAA